MPEYSYPADPAEAGLRMFLGWFGPHYARSTTVSTAQSNGSILTGELTVGRKWGMAVTVINTLAPDATVHWESARAAVEKRLDIEGRAIALWAPRGAVLPAQEPGLSQLMLSLNEATKLEDGRLEVRRQLHRSEKRPPATRLRLGLRPRRLLRRAAAGREQRSQ